LESLKQINLDAAGLDVGASEIYVCVPEGRSTASVRVFSSFTVDLNALADWLSQCQIKTVAMESTGVYWIPIFQILETRGFEVYLVNAQYIKNVMGKKTDILDCQWIQQLLTYGLLHKSFRPDDATCVLRSLVGHRDMLLRYRASHTQHIQKALHQMNLKLTNVLTDVMDQTGMRIIRDILSGVRDPQQLAQHRDHRCGKSAAEIAKSLEGDYRREHVFALQQAVELYDVYTEKLKELGTPKAVVATAYKLARIVYHLLKYQVPFSALPPAQEDARYRERALRNLQQKALKLGDRIVIDSPSDTQAPELVS
jgi:transposase